MGQITGFIASIGPTPTGNGLRWWEITLRSSGEPDPPDVGHWIGRKVSIADGPAGGVFAEGRVVLLAGHIRRALAAAEDALAYHSGDATFGPKDREALDQVRELQALLGGGDE